MAPSLLGEIVSDGVAAFTATMAAGAAVVMSADALITGTADAYVANQNDKATLSAVESQVAGENNAKLKNGPKAGDAPGVTAGGQATDAHGNKLGPSGETRVDRTRSNTREDARNRALGGGSGAVEHSNPSKGRPHWHPTDGKGNKRPSSTHHEYPE